MRNSIAVNDSKIQVQEVRPVTGKSFHALLHDIAMEYGSPQRDEWVVHLNSIDHSDKKLILTHVLDSEEYEWCCQSVTRTEAMFKEHKEYIEKELSDVCDQVYFDYQEEMGMVWGRHRDNGEYYFYRP